jgi:hypothetical protein
MLLLRLRDGNGLALAPELAIGDGALGFWKALHEVWPGTCQRSCWVHKTANVLNLLPKSVYGKAKKDLHAIYEAESRDAAEAAFDRFRGEFGAKYDKAVACLAKDRVALLAFYDFPAEHWKHVRSSNPWVIALECPEERAVVLASFDGVRRCVEAHVRLEIETVRYGRRMNGDGELHPWGSTRCGAD